MESTAGEEDTTETAALAAEAPRAGPASLVGLAAATAGAFGLARLAALGLSALLEEPFRGLLLGAWLLAAQPSDAHALLREIGELSRWVSPLFGCVVGTAFFLCARFTEGDAPRFSRAARWLGWVVGGGAAAVLAARAVTDRWGEEWTGSEPAGIELRFGALLLSSVVLAALGFSAGACARRAVVAARPEGTPRELRRVLAVAIVLPLLLVAAVPLPFDRAPYGPTAVARSAAVLLAAGFALLVRGSALTMTTLAPWTRKAGLLALGTFLAAFTTLHVVAATRHAKGRSHVETYPERFPRTDLVPGLLDEPVELSDMGPGMESVTLLPWGNGEPAMLRSVNGEYRVVDEAFRDVGDFRVAEQPNFLLAVEGGTRGLRYLASIEGDEGSGSLPRFALVDAAGVPSWTWPLPPQRALAAWTPLFGPKGLEGIALGVEDEDGDEDAVVSLGLDGAPRWTLTVDGAPKDLQSHPALPGRFLSVSSTTRLYALEGPAAPPVELFSIERAASEAGRLMGKDGALFPGPSGAPVSVVSGSEWGGRGRRRPLLAAFDDTGGPLWRAELPSEAMRLLLLEPPGSPRLLALATRGGELLIVDEDGALRARSRLPYAEEGEPAYTWSADAGLLGRSTWIVACYGGGSTWVFRLHPERIRAK